MPDPKVVAAFEHRLYYLPDAEQLAQRWADRFVLQRVEGEFPVVPGFSLWAVADHLELRRAGDRRGVWMRYSDLQNRTRGANELVRACRPGRHPQGVRGNRVLDVMAGWGLDGMLLARSGRAIVMVEQNPLLHALLEDFSRRAGLPEVETHCGDGRSWLSGAEIYDLVYLDPMFPVRRKHGLPGKRMQYLSELGADGDSFDVSWLEAAVACASDRVVVKRRLHDPAVVVPDWQIRGRVVRYDVYRGRAVAAGTGR